MPQACLRSPRRVLTGVLTDSVGPAWVFLGAGVLNLALNGGALFVRGIRELD